MDENSKLLDDEKAMEIENNRLKKENNELWRNNINPKDYKQWNWEQSALWILSLDDGNYNQYKNELMKHLKEEEIEGDDLKDIKEDDLMRWGIKKFKDKKHLIKSIKQLINGNQNIDNEGGIHIVYTCTNCVYSNTHVMIYNGIPIIEFRMWCIAYAFKI